MFRPLDRFIDSQTWLDSLAEPLQGWVNSLFSGGDAGKQVKNFLNGTWLGHPLHPVVTDVPIGAWVATLVLDTAASVSGDEGYERAADLTLATGLAAAAGAAASGWTDWSDTYGKDRKVGLVHGLTMVGTVLAYAASLGARWSGNRKLGRMWSNLGLGLLTAGAYLGGDEVYDLGFGVNHTAFLHGPTEFESVMPLDDLQPNKPTKADVKGVPILLVRIQDTLYALDDTCVHAGCSLAGGHLQGASIVCPCHGSQFDLRDGSVINGPATMPEPYYDVRVQNGMIEVKQGT
ncbi:MAG TPA: Rieske 2Fe-2S domain-containing protein [Chloroflexota bacterium]